MRKFELNLKEAWDYFEDLNYDVYQQVRHRVRTTHFKPVPEFIDSISDLLLIPRELPEEEKKKWVV